MHFAVTSLEFFFIHTRHTMKINLLLPKFGLLICCSLFFSLGQAKTSTSNVGAGSTGMQYELVTVCEQKNCQLYLSANGWIDANSTQKFIQLISSLPKQITVLLNSAGGELIAGIELGQTIRDKGFYTQVGRVSLLNPQEKRRNLSQYRIESGECLSACALAFIGGAKRTLNEHSILGVHPIKFNQSKTASNQAQDAQKAITVLGRYIESMGIDRRMLDMMLIDKNEQMQRISLATASQMNIDNSASETFPWRLQATDKGQLLALVTEKHPQDQYTLTLAISKVDKQTFQIVVYLKPMGNKISPRILGDFVAQNPSIEIETDQISISGISQEVWRVQGEGVLKPILISHQDLQKLSQSLGLTVFLSGKEISGIQTRTKFGTVNFKSAINAISK